MRPYHVLECDTLANIQESTLNFIDTHYPKLKNEDALWHKVDTTEYVRSCEPLVAWTRKLGLRIREVSFTVVTGPKDVALHIDEKPVMAKINVPILNTQNSYNQWFEIPHSIIAENQKTNRFGEQYYQFEDKDISDFKMVGEVELIKPIVFNSGIAHNIVFNDQAKFPRVVLSCMFYNEPIGYLEN